MDTHSKELLYDSIKLILENTKTQKAVLIDFKDTNLTIELECNLKNYRSLQSKQLSDVQIFTDLPTTIVSHVVTKQKSVYISDFSRENPFSKDIYFRDYPVISILCLPLIYNKQLTGILYLENKSTQVFYTYNQVKNFKKLINHLTSLFNFIKNHKDNSIEKRDRFKEDYNYTLEEINRIKSSQYGDYFLISLLLDPLQSNKNTSKNVLTEFIIEQNKKFSFKKWSSQIGGDICKTDTIVLSDNHTYTVFVNADAMGKSIQGASGALILGVIFDAVIMRSKVKKNTNLYPEIWLKELYLDLHNVFLSFDGSMYISLCMGLVDNHNGMMYYVNIEHPPTILYRDSKASFINEGKKLWKIGTPEQEHFFGVNLFQLKENDVIIIGSDGRDDIVLEQKDGVKKYQENEAAILQRVEEGGGKLPLILASIKLTGKLVDDISLLRVEYHTKKGKSLTEKLPEQIEKILKEARELFNKGNYKEAIEKIQETDKEKENHPEIYKFLGRLLYNKGEFFKSIEYFQAYLTINSEDDLYTTSIVYQQLIKFLSDVYFLTGEFLNAIECYEDYLNITPSDNEYLYNMSVAYRKLGDLDKAVDFGERLYLRNRKHFYNLINLFHIYNSLNIKERSLEMAVQAAELKPTDEIAKNLSREINIPHFSIHEHHRSSKFP
ncbi:MAG: SpoIIE family protein phosphatase [Leptospiraceae bacterium]|nr:SpoIIE family protein phosphatase [Leptospiraceae bacterium]MCP5494260.1 SpoIIE family protein phosphatase [Leptospiraceae bacterium]